MAEPHLDPKVAWTIRYLHRQEDVVIEFQGQPDIRIPFARTYLEQFDQDARAGMHPPGTKRPKPRRGPCRIKHIPRDNLICDAVDELMRDGLSERAACGVVAKAVHLSPDTIRTAVRNTHKRLPNGPRY